MGLQEIWSSLTLAAQTAPLRWHRRKLPNGAEVAVKRGPDNRLMVAIGRRAENPDKKAWERELAIFRKYFEIEGWPQSRDIFTKERQVRTYHEPTR